MNGRRSSAGATLCAALALGAFTSARTAGGGTTAAARGYTVTDLGTLPGSSFSDGYAINDEGVAVGFCTTDDFTYRAFVKRPGAPMADLTPPAEWEAQAFSINNAGAVVGVTQGPEGCFAVVWEPDGELVKIPRILDTGCARAWDINDAGWVVGHDFNNDVQHAFLWHRMHGLQDLGDLGEHSARAEGINARNVVVGISTVAGGLSSQPFRWTSRTGMTQLPSLPSSLTSVATAINDHGMVVGIDWATWGESRAFRWTRREGIVRLPGGPAQAEDVNDAGEIAGFIFDRGAVIWSGEGITDLGPGAPRGINRRGQVVGTGPGNHATVWSPSRRP
jgi:probable HAF family extracellular repeat protein